ncbi:MAG: hypothetical protein H0Z33_15240 [Bacillaceae bacterium]|nr:hypothetical protein [Bacillaceae bacterium]
MEFEIMSRDGAFPCEVTIDEENGRYTIRNADTTGEFFESPEQLVEWIQLNWNAEQFVKPDEYESLVQHLHEYLHLAD